jgi:hypothetical protein
VNQKHISFMKETEHIGAWVILQAGALEVHGLNISQYIGCPERYFSWSYSVLSGNCMYYVTSNISSL